MRMIKGLGALVVYAGIVVGIPWALIAIAGNPLPTSEQWNSLLQGVPDYGLVITMTKILPLIAWIAWAWFVIPFIGELFTAGRKRTSARKTPAIFRGQQKLATTLIAAIAIMFAGGATGAIAATPAHAETVNSLVLTPTVEAAPTAPEPAAAAAAPTAATVTSTVTHIVAHGDTLWDLAEKYYGQGQRYQEIFDANRGVTQHDGRALTNPDLIVTGWTLTVPNAHIEQAPAAPAPLPPQAPPASTGASSAHDGAGAGAGVGGGAATGGGSGAVGGSTGAGAATNEAPAPQVKAPTTPVENDTATDPAIPLATAGGIVSLLVAGLLAALGTKRLRQRRQRRAGERIAMPEQAAADLELELRLVENPIGVEDIDNALRSLQEWAEDSGSHLPELLAVRLAEDEIAVYLTEPADLPEPFEAAHPDRTAWVVRPGRATPPTRPTVSPYPALTTIGTDDAGGVLLLDLEQIGSLNVVGDEETARGVLTAIAVELSVNPWSDQIHVTLVGMPHGLARELGRFRVDHVDDVAALIRNLRADMQDRREALDSYGVTDVHEARVKATEIESWAPHIVILGAEPEEAQRLELAELVARMPRLGIATVASSEAIPAASTVVITDRTTAEYRSGGQLPPLPFHPQILAGEELKLIQNLFETTGHAPHTADLSIEPPAVAEATVSDAVDEPTETEGEAARAAAAAPTAESPDADVQRAASAEPSTAEEDGTALDAAVVETGSVEEVAPAPELATVTAPDWPAPYVRMLGPVDVLNVTDPEALPGRGVELMAYLLLRGGPVPGAQLQKAFWPDSTNTDNNHARQLAKNLRDTLGSDPDGHKLLPEGRNTIGFTIHPAIRSDWDDFRQLIGPDLKATPNDDLIAAIRLVRGQPLTPTKKRRGWWAWRAPMEEEMLAAILDAADELAHRALRSGDVQPARFAARIAQSADPLNEAGWRLELEAAMRAGNADEFARIVDDLYAGPGGGDPDYELDDATQELIDAGTEKLTPTR